MKRNNGNTQSNDFSCTLYDIFESDYFSSWNGFATSADILQEKCIFNFGGIFSLISTFREPWVRG